MKKLAVLLAFLPMLAVAQVYNQFSPGGDLAGTGSTWNSQVITNGAVTLTKMANVIGNAGGTATPALIGNNTSVSSTPAALTPLQVTNVASLVMNVTVACDGTCLPNFSGVTVTGTTLPSGLSTTVDGVSLIAGQTVLITGYTTNSQLNGIYIAETGTWVRAVNFVGSIAQNCDVDVTIRQGAVYGGASFYLVTTGSAITIGTTAQTWTLMQIPAGVLTAPTGASELMADYNGAIGPIPFITWNPTVSPNLLTIGSGYNSAEIIGAAPASTNNGTALTFQGAPGGSTSGNGGSFQLIGGAATEGNGGGVNISGTTGATVSATAHNGGSVQITAGAAVSGGTPGTITINGAIKHGLGNSIAPTLSAGSLVSGSTNNAGRITGLSGAASVTLTFGQTMSGRACVANTDAATPITISVTSMATTAATFTFASSYTGGMDYICL